MKMITWVLLLLALGCRSKSDISIDPAQLTGTWITRSADTPNRWTFDPTYLYMANDTLSSCQPAGNVHQLWEYRTEKDMLITRFAGITNGLFPVDDVHFSIVSLTEQHLVLLTANNRRIELERCK